MKITGISVETATYMLTFYSHFISCMSMDTSTNLYTIIINDVVNIYIHNKDINLEFGGKDFTINHNCYTSFEMKGDI